MTETLPERLRAAALLDAHFAVPAERDEIVLLLHDAAEELDAIRQRAETALVAGPQPSARAAVDAWMDVFVARSQYFEDTLAKANDKIRDLKRDCIDAGLALQGMRQDNETLRNMLIEARRLVDVGLAARRAFLEQAVCHPGPPASEHEDYDPEAPLGELEAAVLERMDLELKHERDLREIQRVLEEAIGRTPDPTRSAVQVARDAAEHISAARTYRANMESPPADLEAHERAYDALLAWTRAMGLSPPAQPTPVVRPEHFAGPFPAISGYVKRTREARAAVVDQALGMLGEGQRLAVHDEPERVDILFLDPGQDPPSGQTWAVYGPLSAEYREAIKASLDRERRGLLRPLTPREQDVSPAVSAHMATLRANSADRSPGPHPKAEEWQKLIDGLRRTMAEASAEHDGDDTTRRMYRPQTYRPGSPIPERAPADYHPAEYMTPEQEAEAAEQAERFQGLDDSDRG